jgi:hypothetical protein
MKSRYRFEWNDTIVRFLRDLEASWAEGGEWERARDS